MRRNRVAPPIDLMAELEGDDDDPKKQSTLTQQPTLVGPQTAPKPTLTTQKTIVQPTTAASRPSSARTAPRTTVSFRQRTPPAQPSATNRTNYRLFKPLTPAQRKMLETEYYVNKNFYGRDKLYASLQRKHGDAAPTQKAINDWLLQQETHQLHRRQFKSQTITPIKNVRVPNQLWMADLIDLTSRADNGFKWALTVVDVFSRYAWAVAMKNKQNQTVTAAMADILKSQKPRLLQTDNGSEFISGSFQALLRKYSVNHITGLAGRAFSQGPIERWNGTLKSAIGRLWTARGNKRWVADLPDIVRVYNNNVHASTGVAPADVNRENKQQMKDLNERNDKRVATSNTEHAPTDVKVGDKVRLKVMKGSIDSSTTKQNWTRELFTVSRVKQPEGSKAATFKVTDADGDVRKDIYTATDIQKVDADRIQRSPITIAPRSAPRRPRTRQRAAVSLRQGAPRRSARLAGR